MSRIKVINNPHFLGIKIEKTLWFRLRSAACDRNQSTSEYVRRIIEKDVGEKNKVK